MPHAAAWSAPVREPRGRKILAALVVLAAALLACLPGLTRLPPVDRDEARFVQATKQMVEAGDYVDIRFQTETRYKKPVGIYWLQAAAVALSGDGAQAPVWVYRTVSVLAVAVAALAAFWAGSGLFGTRAGLVAGLVLAGLFGCAFEGRVAKTDAALLAFSVLAQGALAQIYIATQRGQAPPRTLPWIFWAAQGCAILIKGPVTPLLSLLTVAAVCIHDRQWRWLKTLRPLLGLLLAAAIVAPWLVLITLKGGAAFWQESVGKDLAGKLAQGSESHWGPPGYYVLTYSLYFWPWGFAAVAAGLLALRRFRDDPRLRFCLAWYVPFWLVLEVVGTKLPHYVLPAYPGAILLVGWAASLKAEDLAAPALWEKIVRWSAAAGVAVVALAFAALCIGAPIYLDRVFSWWSVPAAAAVLLTGWLALRAARPTPNRAALVSFCAVVSYALMFGVVFPSVKALWLSPRIAAAVAQHRPCPTSVLASDRYHEPSLVFLAGTETVMTDAAGAAQHLLSDPACALSLVSADGEAPFRAAVAAAGRVPQPLAAIDGLNYSSGRRMSLTLYGLQQ